MYVKPDGDDDGEGLGDVDDDEEPDDGDGTSRDEVDAFPTVVLSSFWSATFSSDLSGE